MQAFHHTPLLRRLSAHWGRRLLTQSCTGVEVTELSNELRRQIEAYWRDKLPRGKFDPTQTGEKFYVLSMFPYPSGSLHMGHVRVYAISDTVARFYSMCGKNVFQPMGWDAFGLPAENAANERGVEPAVWTQHNIELMKEQLQALGCAFDWTHELSTCSPDYYKWTQKLFLMLYKQGLAYQNEALVNWDPVDKTVLAHEQVDENGFSWRSGAKVEKRLLKQWFVRTTKFAKNLYDGLDDPTLREWRDIKALQRHWIGECDGYVFHLLTSAANYLRVWTQHPEYLKDRNAFVVLRPTHHLAKVGNSERLTVENPFTGTSMPVIFSEDPPFADKCDVYLAAPSISPFDKEMQIAFDLPFFAQSAEHDGADGASVGALACAEVLESAKRLKIGGYRVSSKLQDWLVSRQRYWGTPIPMLHCKKCGAVPVPESELPVFLPEKAALESDRETALRCKCPVCGASDAQRETDTMDTFVDSSWYFLRFLDPNNDKQIFSEDVVKKCMPVDLYIGGKEHAVLHLYYARFMNHFLHSQGLVPTPEPFSCLLVQGMVMGRSFKVKNRGRYVKEAEVEIVNAKKNQARLKDTKEPVTMIWEKMSKSKLNGVDPDDMFREYGTDTTRLIMLADVAPTSHRNWSSATFPGILNWQKRLWLTISDLHAARTAPEGTIPVDVESKNFLEEDAKLYDSRNYYIKGATFNYRHSHQFSVAISKMQGLTNSLRRASKAALRSSLQFERALATQIIMLAPLAPHFASELWSKFVSVPGRLQLTTTEINWEGDVLQQHWPQIDQDYKVDLTIKINGFENCVVKIPRSQIDNVTHNDAMDLAFNTASVTTYLMDRRIGNTNFVLYPGIEAQLHIFADKTQKLSNAVEDTDNLLANK